MATSTAARYIADLEADTRHRLEEAGRPLCFEGIVDRLRQIAAATGGKHTEESRFLLNVVRSMSEEEA